MDLGSSAAGGFGGLESPGADGKDKQRELPDDLPKSLDDRRRVRTDYVPETELYDGWQGG